MKRIISLKEVKYPHTGIAIEEALVSCLTEWGIRDKVFTLTVDNASNNNRACDVFVEYQKYELMLEGAHFHVKCCAHILNILVQDGMNIIHDPGGQVPCDLTPFSESDASIFRRNEDEMANKLKPRFCGSLVCSANS